VCGLFGLFSHLTAKQSLFFVMLKASPCLKNAQSVGINATGAAPDNSAMLVVSSTTQGFFPPRMTYVQFPISIVVVQFARLFVEILSCFQR
jgi:hypothetical protein